MSGEHNSLLDKETILDGDHPIFFKDPSEWMKLVHTHVCITTDDGMQHKGWVYTVDPVSESIVLVDRLDADPPTSSDNSTVSVQILIGQTITQVESLPTTVLENDVRQSCDRLFRPSTETPSLDNEEILKRKSDLKAWLEKHRIPVSIEGRDGQSLSVLSDALIIQPPYMEEDCLSTNEIILSKIQGLVKIMPKT